MLLTLYCIMPTSSYYIIWILCTKLYKIKCISSFQLSCLDEELVNIFSSFNLTVPNLCHDIYCIVVQFKADNVDYDYLQQ